MAIKDLLKSRRIEGKKIEKEIKGNIKKLKHINSKIISLESKNKKEQFISSQKNNKFEVLFEKYEDGVLSGWTQNYIKVNDIGIEELLNTINTIE